MRHLLLFGALTLFLSLTGCKAVVGLVTKKLEKAPVGTTHLRLQPPCRCQPFRWLSTIHLGIFTRQHHHHQRTIDRHHWRIDRPSLQPVGSTTRVYGQHRGAIERDPHTVCRGCNQTCQPNRYTEKGAYPYVINDVGYGVYDLERGFL